MTAPSTRARREPAPVPGVLHWTVLDDRIDFRSDAYAVASPAGPVLIDPLPMEDDDLAELGRPAAICLTAGSHQRAAWDLRARLGTPVYAPVGARGLEERPDAVFTPGDVLPGGLRALACPGPFGPHHALLARPAGALFVGDLLLRPDPRGRFIFPPDRHMDDPGRARTSARRLLTAPAHVLCPGHGAPEPVHARDALRAALRADG